MICLTFNVNLHLFFLRLIFCFNSHNLNIFCLLGLLNHNVTETIGFWLFIHLSKCPFIDCHTCFMVLGLALSSDNSLAILTLCSLVHVTPKLVVLEL
jgi:hypothetical protein